MSQTDHPVAEITKITRVHLHIDCPHCGGEHTHGNAHDLDVGDKVQRSAHCRGTSGAYWLKRTERTEVRD